MRSPVRNKKAQAQAEPQPPAKKKIAVLPLTLNPRLSEKAYGLSEERNTYIFDIEPGMNRFDVSRAVAGQYEVGVVKVRIASVPGKSVRTYRQRGRKSVSGQRSAIRKAYVTLQAGDKLPIFAAVENPEAPKEEKK